MSRSSGSPAGWAGVVVGLGVNLAAAFVAWQVVGLDDGGTADNGFETWLVVMAALMAFTFGLSVALRSRFGAGLLIGAGAAIAVLAGSVVAVLVLD